jgi:hypothetical protein
MYCGEGKLNLIFGKHQKKIIPLVDYEGFNMHARNSAAWRPHGRYVSISHLDLTAFFEA